MIRRPQFVSVYHIGIAVGLVSITFFFGALILAFGFRISDAQSWRRFHAPGLLWVSTAALIASSVALEGSRWALRRGLVVEHRGRMLATLALAALFLLCQAASAFQLHGQGVAAASNPHGSAFYVFMGLHGLHLVGGFLWLTSLYSRARRSLHPSETDLRKTRTEAGAAALYWHFMGLLWLVLFFFLLRWTG